MCALLDRKNYTESRIGVVEVVYNGQRETLPSGEYVATCAKQRCGFMRESTLDL